MPLPAPLIEKRSVDQIMADTKALLQLYAGWQPGTDGTEPGQALVGIFARLAELVIDRLNQVPEKNFLAFLDLIGLELLPPQAARVPLTFALVAGSTTDAVAPVRTPVAAMPLEGESVPVTFETERELTITRSRLVAAFTREPGRDLYRNSTEVATARDGGIFPVFEGDQSIGHRLYLGFSGLFVVDVPKTITLSLTPAESDAPWLAAVAWTYWDGTLWQTVTPAAPPALRNGHWEVILPGVQSMPVTSVSGKTSAWLCASLTTSLPHGDLALDAATGRTTLSQTNLAPDAGFADDVRLDLSLPFAPLGRITPRTSFYLACDSVFSKPGAVVAITVAADPMPLPQPSAVLVWEYGDGTTWQLLGRSSPSSSSITTSGFGFIDDTRAFTRPGIISFTSPSGWPRGVVNGETRYWLRARIESGNYGTGPDYRPPIVEQVSLGYTWPVPRIDTIQAILRITRNQLPSDLAFTNQSPADLAKDFFPFGEKPKFNDTFYLSSNEVFSKPGANVTLLVTVTSTNPTGTPPKAVPSPDLTLFWEFWNGQQGTWDLLGVSGPGARGWPNVDQINRQYEFGDATNGLVDSVSGGSPITFRCPEMIAPVEVSGQRGYWIRVRIAAGNYGVEAHQDQLRDANGNVITYPNTNVPIMGLVPASFKPPSIRSLTLSYDYTSNPAPPDYVLSDNDFRLVDQSQVIRGGDGQTFLPYTPTADTRPAFYLGFERPGDDTGFANRSTALYFSPEQLLYGEAPGTSGAQAEQVAVEWEYWNGSDWARLGTRDETEGFQRRGMVSFVGPVDFRASNEFGREAFWLRVRWTSGDYATPPRLHRVLTNTVWATHTQTLQNEILGSSSGERDQVFHTTKAPVLPGQRIEVREAEPPSSPERVVIEAEEGHDAITTIRDTSNRPVEVWVRWHEVPDFYESGPRSRHYMLDRLTGEVRFGNGQRGLVPPEGRANLRVSWYQTGGGEAGNRAAGNITQLKTTLPYVDSVTNYEPSGGGADQERVEAIKFRGPKTLRHRDRAVAIADFEDLAFQTSTDVARVKGIPASGAAAGTIGLIIVPKTPGPKPIPSLELLSSVERYIEARLPATADLWVAGPDWLRVSVAAEIVPVSPEQATDVQTAVMERLRAFLHPLTGGLDSTGWDFGRQPHRSDLFALAEGTAGVDHIRRLVVTAVADEGNARPDRFLVYSGDHQIVMVGEGVE